MFKFDKFRVQMRQHFMHLSIYILWKSRFKLLMWLWRQHVLFYVGVRTLTQDRIWLSWVMGKWVLRSSCLNSQNSLQVQSFSNALSWHQDGTLSITTSQEFIEIMKRSDMKSSREGPQYLADVFNEISNNCKVCSFINILLLQNTTPILLSRTPFLWLEICTLSWQSWKRI